MRWFVIWLLLGVGVMADRPSPDVAEQVQRYLTGDPVVDRALGLLPPMPNKVKPMKRTDLNPQVQRVLTPTAAAFHTPGSTDLTVFTDSPMYAAAQNEKDKLAQYLLASALLHEHQHDKDPGELGPYTAQLQFMQQFKPDGDAESFKRYQESMRQLTAIIDRLKRGGKP